MLGLALAKGGFFPTALGIFALLVWLAVLVVLLLGPRQLAADSLLVVAAALGLAALSGLSLAWSPDPGAGFESFVRFGAYGGLLALVAITPTVRARQWLAAIALAIGALAIVSLATRIAVRLPGDESLAAQVPSAAGRLSFPIGYWNGLAACMALGVVLSAWFAAHGASARVRGIAAGSLPVLLSVAVLAESRGAVAAAVVGSVALVAVSRRRGRLLVALGLGTAATLVVALALSGFDDLRAGSVGPHAQRDGIALLGVLVIAATLSGRLYALLEPRAGRFDHLRPGRRGLAGTAVAALVAIAIAGGPGGLLASFQDPLVSVQPGISSELAGGTGRYQYWQAGLEAFRSEPLLGIGAGGYESWWNQHGSLERGVRFAHSLGVGVAAEFGLIGLLLLAAMIGPALLGSFSRARRGGAGRAPEAAFALICTGLASSALEWTWEIPAATAPFLIAIAISVGPDRAGHCASGVCDRLARLLGRATPRNDVAIAQAGITRPLLTVFAVISIWAGVIATAGSLRLSQSDALLADGRLEAAAREARAAAGLAPWDSKPRELLGRIEAGAGDFDAAIAELDLAVERAPEDWELWLTIAQVRERQGEKAAQLSALARASQLNTAYPVLSRFRDN